MEIYNRNENCRLILLEFNFDDYNSSPTLLEKFQTGILENHSDGTYE